MSWQTRPKVEAGPFGLDLAGQRYTGAFVKTTYPDGSYSYAINLQYSDNVPLQVVQRLDVRAHPFVHHRAGETEAFHLDEAWSGEFCGDGPAEAGKVTATFTNTQLGDLMQQTHGAIRSTSVDGQQTSASTHLRSLVGGYTGMLTESNLEFAINLGAAWAAANRSGSPKASAGLPTALTASWAWIRTARRSRWRSRMAEVQNLRLKPSHACGRELGDGRPATAAGDRSKTA